MPVESSIKVTIGDIGSSRSLYEAAEQPVRRQEGLYARYDGHSASANVARSFWSMPQWSNLEPV
jgi:hypothetical protein